MPSFLLQINYKYYKYILFLKILLKKCQNVVKYNRDNYKKGNVL